MSMIECKHGYDACPKCDPVDFVELSMDMDEVKQGLDNLQAAVAAVCHALPGGALLEANTKLAVARAAVETLIRLPLEIRRETAGRSHQNYHRLAAMLRGEEREREHVTGLLRQLAAQFEQGGREPEEVLATEIEAVLSGERYGTVGHNER